MAHTARTMSAAAAADKIAHYRRVRKELGISQMKLARLSGVARSAISLAETGEGTLLPEEQKKIKAALLDELDRISKIRIPVETIKRTPKMRAGSAR